MPGAGCAGDDALTRDEYVSRLNAMCEDFAAREERIGEPETVADIVEFGPEVVEAFEEAILEPVDRLEPPDELAEQAHRLAVIAHRQHDILSDLVKAAQDGDFTAVRSLASENAASNQEASAVATELGAEACA